MREYARIAFADMRKIANWVPGDNGLNVTPSENLLDPEAAAIAEIVAGASSGRVYRIKLHDKTQVLGALARCLRMLPARQLAPNEDDATDDDGEDPHEFLIRELDRLVAQADTGSESPGAERDGCPRPEGSCGTQGEI